MGLRTGANAKEIEIMVELHRLQLHHEERAERRREPQNETAPESDQEGFDMRLSHSTAGEVMYWGGNEAWSKLMVRKQYLPDPPPPTLRVQYSVPTQGREVNMPLREPDWTNGMASLYCADARDLPLEDESVDCVVTSPPYFNLRDFQAGDGEIGLEDTIAKYVQSVVEVGAELHRVLKRTGTLWIVIDDSRSGSNKGQLADGSRSQGGDKQSSHRGTAHQPVRSKRQPKRTGDFVTRWGGGDKWVEGMPRKNLMGIPERVVLALQAWGWIYRDEIIWKKPNPMRSSAKDRTTRAHEKIYMFSKGPEILLRHRSHRGTTALLRPALGIQSLVFGEAQERRKPGYEGRSRRSAAARERNDTEKDWVHPLSVWEIRNPGYRGPHHATFPLALAEKMVLAGCPPDGVVLDPFIGRGTTCIAAQNHGRRSIGVDLNPNYVWLSSQEIMGVSVPRDVFDEDPEKPKQTVLEL